MPIFTSSRLSLGKVDRYQQWKTQFLLGIIEAGVKPASSFDLPVQAVRLGDEILLLALGGETVVDYSLRFKNEFSELKGWKPMLWFAGYSTDVSLYLPSLRVLKEGGYEGGGHMMYTQFTGPFQPDVEERTFAAIREVVNRVSN